jgi:prolyl 4-hydroxylase
VDEDWPLEVYTRFGDAMNITMRPFDMVFYESHSLIHGRPFPLVGRYYANIFIHFEAIGERLDGTVEQLDPESRLPPYILPNSPYAEQYLEQHPEGWSKVLSEKDYDWLLNLAAEGDLERLKEFLDLDPRLINVTNEDGWQVRGAQDDTINRMMNFAVDHFSHVKFCSFYTMLWKKNNLKLSSS